MTGHVNGDKFVTHKHMYTLVSGMTGTLLVIAGIVYNVISPVPRAEIETNFKHVNGQLSQLYGALQERWANVDKRLGSIDTNVVDIQKSIAKLEARTPERTIP